MNIQLWSVGRPHDNALSASIEDYTKRINRYYPTSWKIIAPPKNAAALPENELKKKEGEIILSLLSNTDHLVALDERGKMFSSQKLAQFMEMRLNENMRQLIFLIGGAYGIHETVITRANFSWSLSELTFPHQLVRLILAEQVYRACTILRNEKYHHS